MNKIRKAFPFVIGFLIIFPSLLSSQDQRIADSLRLVYEADSLEGIAKLELLKKLSFNESNDQKLSLEYAQELINLSEETENISYLFQGYFSKGNVYRILGDIEEAIEAYFKSAEIAKQAGKAGHEGSAYGAIADIYAISENYSNANLYYDKAIEVLRVSDDTIALASYISNAGDALMNSGNYQKALEYFEESGDIFQDLGYEIGKAYSLGNTGMVYANIGNNSTAEKNINEAISILEDYEDYYSISVYLVAMSDLYKEKGALKEALNYAGKSLDLAQKYELKDQISDANLKLSQLYEKNGNVALSLKHFKEHIAYRDSIKNLETIQELADQRTDFEVSQKQLEVDLLDQEKKNQQLITFFTFLFLLAIGLLAFGLFKRNQFISKTKSIIEKEKDRSEELLLNILPQETAEELKSHGKVEAVKFDEVTVLFTDFVKFSSVAESIDPKQLVKSIDFYFKKFDEIGEKHGLEKIKTIGDAYMTACGLPSPDPIHAQKVAEAAKEMVEFVNAATENKNGIHHFEIRVGIHTGPVVAGVVGSKKFAYDIWGDTVNIASRMETNSIPGKINISETTYNKVKEKFDCEYRGEIEAKNRGKLKMYFLS